MALSYLSPVFFSHGTCDYEGFSFSRVLDFHPSLPWPLNRAAPGQGSLQTDCRCPGRASPCVLSLPLPARLPPSGRCGEPCPTCSEPPLPSDPLPRLRLPVPLHPTGLSPTGILPSLWLATTKSPAGRAGTGSLPGAVCITPGTTGTKSAS